MTPATRHAHRRCVAELVAYLFPGAGILVAEPSLEGPAFYLATAAWTLACCWIIHRTDPSLVQ